MGGKFDIDDLNDALNSMGRKGWELVKIVPTAKGYGSTEGLLCVFKREAR